MADSRHNRKIEDNPNLGQKGKNVEKIWIMDSFKVGNNTNYG